MPRRPGRDLAVGAMFSLALVIVALAVMAVGGETGIFFAKAYYQVVFPEADGLLVGAPVKMSGVNIGTVSKIRLPTDPGGAGIEVQVSLDPSYADRVREDSRAALRILQMLTNEKFVEITPGSPDRPALEENAEIPRHMGIGVLEQGEAIAENLSEITVALKGILGPLERGEGLIGQMLQDPDFGRKGLESLGGTLENTRQIAEDLRAGKGVVGRLLYDETLAAKLDELEQSIGDFTSLVSALSRREGVIGELLEDQSGAHRALQDLSESAASLHEITRRLDSGQGLLGRLLNDPDYSDALARDLETTARSVAEITDKINLGDGSLGAMVNDRALYDGAQSAVSGVNDSKFARWLLRRYQKKGIMAEDKRLQEQAGD